MTRLRLLGTAAGPICPAMSVYAPVSRGPFLACAPLFARAMVAGALLLAGAAAAETPKAVPIPKTTAAAPAPPPAPATAQAADKPKQIGKFGEWTAATYKEAGQTICYALTSTPPIAGRGAVVMTVTKRPAGPQHETVAIDVGYAFPANATVTVRVDQTELKFYTNEQRKRNAFALDTDIKGLVAAFGKGSQAIAKSSGPKGPAVTDTFSLKGFGDAYKAIAKACPPK